MPGFHCDTPDLFWGHATSVKYNRRTRQRFDEGYCMIVDRRFNKSSKLYEYKVVPEAGVIKR